MYEEYQVRVYGYVVEWHQNGKRHRLDGPALEYADGERLWYNDGKLHRIDGPAIEHANGGRSWYQNGKLHRLDGPAIEDVDGSKEWWIDDLEYTEEDYHKKIAEMNAPSCEGKEVEIDGQIYILTLKE